MPANTAQIILLLKDARDDRPDTLFRDIEESIEEVENSRGLDYADFSQQQEDEVIALACQKAKTRQENYFEEPLEAEVSSRDMDLALDGYEKFLDKSR